MRDVCKLVLDEADRMLDMGLLTEISRIGAVKMSCVHTALELLTFHLSKSKSSVNKYAKQIMTLPAKPLAVKLMC